ncbi:MAG: DNA-binding transcriptional regulator, AcrR family [Chloroflexi bacterium AL-W]|nr:DNA-binding transcriptional regulator, AcrR family [Chloroflexi bacterium AL-N1]NOK66377.1 DNA-binding transcriptional regulator, AcrR family [Chloroflexi bacterium AL-N10]NOK71765.1 DNA-binding transcriptional regulator, AcrR family [Chloroflexi bacterium AL-N5]NOK81022.1 DNA-binding transcriptional regulator, AcrR family [Chloroflexi bacterium AL-W]NOK89295.1 DNA-binding transcriptional regulator, AcrR family [Chloroflexi bacterium AL-N15]
MRTKKTTRQRSASFIEQARRTQIVACAIETIADLGYTEASLAQIGQRAKVSKGVITYYFTSKAELIQAVIDHVYSQFVSFVMQRMMDDDPWKALQTFIQANADFLKAHRKQLLTLFEIARNAHGLPLHGYTPQLDVDRIAKMLAEGQQQGTFRDFDVVIMATSILALRDSLITQSAKHIDLDIDHYVQEIIVLIAHATRQSS